MTLLSLSGLCPRRRRKLRHSKAFTLVEMVVVLFILAILVAVAIAAGINTAKYEAKDSALGGNLRTLNDAVTRVILTDPDPLNLGRTGTKQEAYDFYISRGYILENTVTSIDNVDFVDGTWVPATPEPTP